MQGFHGTQISTMVNSQVIMYQRLCADKALTSTLPSSVTLRRDATAGKNSVRHQSFGRRGSCDRGCTPSRLLKLQCSRLLRLISVVWLRVSFAVG